MFKYFQENIEPQNNKLKAMLDERDLTPAEKLQVEKLIKEHNQKLEAYDQADQELGMLLWRRDNIDKQIEEARENVRHTCDMLGHNYAGDTCENCGFEAPDPDPELGQR